MSPAVSLNVLVAGLNNSATLLGVLPAQPLAIRTFPLSSSVEVWTVRAKRGGPDVAADPPANVQSSALVVQAWASPPVISTVWPSASSAAACALRPAPRAGAGALSAVVA